MELRFPSIVRLCSYDVDLLNERHAEHLAFYNASNETDCTLGDSYVTMEPIHGTREFRRVLHYTLTIHTYLGWKVYMLHTGCFATILQYEK